MWGKAARYALLSFCSFWVFTALFHTVASAQSSDSVLSANIAQIFPSEMPLPTPTIFLYVSPAPQILSSNTSSFPTSSPDTVQSEPEPTPTPKAIPTIFILLTPTPTLVPTATPTPIESAPTIVPTALPKPVVTGSSDLETLFTTYGEMYHVDKEQLKRIAKCESGFRVDAVNGPYLGMFQFAASSWASVRAEMGLDANSDLRTNAEEAIRTTAYMISKGRSGAWPNCN